MEWIAEVDCTLQTTKEWRSLKEVKQYLEENLPLLSAKSYQGGDYKSGFPYSLESLFCLRGSSKKSRGEWLTSDAIHMEILSLKKELRERNSPGYVFILPPFHWDTDSTVALPESESLKKRRAGSGKFTKKHAQHFLRSLEQQKDELTTAAADYLAKGAVYTVVNKCGNHWLSVEACIRTRSVLVYDPADTLGPRAGSGSDKYFTKVRAVLDLLLEKRTVPRPLLKFHEWKTAWASGGQQFSTGDSVNCGVYAVEWIRFRVQSAVLFRRELERKERTSLLRERLRQTTLSVFDGHFINKLRMHIAEFALREIKRIQSERGQGEGQKEENDEK